MKYPIIQYTGNEGGSTSTWKGLNRTDSCRHGEFSDEINLDTERYPVLSACRDEAPGGFSIGKAKVMACLSDTDNGFCGVVLQENCVRRTMYGDEEGEDDADQVLRYKITSHTITNKKIGVNFPTVMETNFVFRYGGEIKTIGFLNVDDEDITDYNALWVYDVADDVSKEDIEKFRDNLERVKWTLKRLGKRIVINGYDPVLQRGRFYMYDIEENKLVRSSEQVFVPAGKIGTIEIREVMYNRVISKNKNAIDFASYFYEGDYLTISALYPDPDGENIKYDVYPFGRGDKIKTTSIFEIKQTYVDDDGSSVKASCIYFLATRNNGSFWYYDEDSVDGWGATKEFSFILGTHVPPMDEIEVYGGRVWGISSKDNTVFASVYDTPFKVINTDENLNIAASAEFPLDGVGALTGITSAGSELLVFNSDTLYRISGAGSSSYAILGRYNHCGCIDSRSVAEFGGTVYYLGRHGFMAYEGSQPVLISQKLNAKYSEAVGLTDGIKYYVSAKRDDTEEWEYLVYDPRYAVWHVRKNEPFVTGYNSDGKLYVCRNEDIEKFVMNEEDGSSTSVKDWCVSTYEIDGTELKKNWFCESGILVESTLDFKGINELWIRAVIPENDHIEVYTAINDEELTLRQTLTGKGRMFIYKIPVRFGGGDYWRYRLKGTSGAAVFQMERKYNTEGRRHYAY